MIQRFFIQQHWKMVKGKPKCTHYTLTEDYDGKIVKETGELADCIREFDRISYIGDQLKIFGATYTKTCYV